MASYRLFVGILACGLAVALNTPVSAGSSDGCVTVNETATSNCLWKVGVDQNIGQVLTGYKISEYRILWPNGWSITFYPGINDKDGVLTDGGTCQGVTYNRGQPRLMWSYFYDHYHSYTVCPEMPRTTASPNDGDGCNPASCRLQGTNCTSYKTCNKATSKWETLHCGDGLFWNPNWNENITGGSCDEWDNLHDTIQVGYKADLACFPVCYYKKNGECSQNYIYHPTGSDYRVTEVLKCPSKLVWAEDRQTCDRCQHVLDSVTGRACCF